MKRSPLQRKAPLRRTPAEAKLTVKPFRPKRCKGCGEKFTPVRQMQSACTPACALKLAAATRQKAERAADRVKREKLKTRSDWIREAQAATNRYVRLRDHGRPCISCGAMPEQRYGGTIDAGHFRSIGSAPHLRFYTLQIAAQCVRCNRHLGGNAIEFRRGLVYRHGLAKVEAIEAMQGSPKWTVEYLRRLKKLMSRKAARIARRLGL